jgi:hypothetical protein
MALRALVAAVPAWAIARTAESIPPVAFAAGVAVYASTYLVLSYAPGIAEPAAIRVPVVQRLRALLSRRRHSAVTGLAPMGGK